MSTNRSDGPTTIRRRPAAVVALAVATALAGCYEYTPAQLTPAPPLGEDVRVAVSRQSAEELSEAIDLTDLSTPYLIGVLERADDDALMVRVPLPPSEYGSPRRSDVGQLLRVPRAQILGIERRRFDSVRSSLLVGGLIAGSALILTEIMDTSGSAPESVEGPMLLQLRLPLGMGLGR